MHSKVKILRINGRRRSDSDISTDEGRTGNLIACTVAGVPQLDLVDPASASALTRLCEPLYEPMIVSMQGARMLIRGWERRGEGRGAGEWRQEWSVEVLPGRPGEL